MMGRSHALSGAVGWLGGCAALASAGVALPGVVVAAGAAISAGFALVPDIDHPGSTVARTLGPASQGFAAGVARVAALVRDRSCLHCAGRNYGGHRGLTHTAIGAIAVGLLAWFFGAVAGLFAGQVIAGFAVWLAAHTALSSTTRARLGDLVLPGRFRSRGKGSFRFTAGVGALLVAFLAVQLVAQAGPGAGWWWVGVAVAWGCLAHSLGDAMTLSRVPLLWPLEVRGCRWAPVGTPRWMRFRTGSRTETVVAVGLAVVGVAAVRVLAAAS